MRLYTIILPFFLSFLSFFIYFSEILFWNASSARLPFWLQKIKHLPTCELEKSRGGGGAGGRELGRGSLTGYRCSNLVCV